MDIKLKKTSEELNIDKAFSLAKIDINYMINNGTKFCFFKSDDLLGNLNNMNIVMNKLINEVSNNMILVMVSTMSDYISLLIYVPKSENFGFTSFDIIDLVLPDNKKEIYENQEITGCYKCLSDYFKEIDNCRQRFFDIMRKYNLYIDEEDNDNFGELAEIAGIEW
jgi:hypothetical protein